eukprot:scaffold115137_cov75-Phaeocystis_antarctica.AAC.1
MQNRCFVAPLALQTGCAIVPSCTARSVSASSGGRSMSSMKSRAPGRESNPMLVISSYTSGEPCQPSTEIRSHLKPGCSLANVATEWLELPAMRLARCGQRIEMNRMASCCCEDMLSAVHDPILPLASVAGRGNRSNVSVLIRGWAARSAAVLWPDPKPTSHHIVSFCEFAAAMRQASLVYWFSCWSLVPMPPRGRRPPGRLWPRLTYAMMSRAARPASALATSAVSGFAVGLIARPGWYATSSMRRARSCGFVLLYQYKPRGCIFKATRWHTGPEIDMRDAQLETRRVQ